MLVLVILFVLVICFIEIFLYLYVIKRWVVVFKICFFVILFLVVILGLLGFFFGVLLVFIRVFFLV